MCKYGYDFRDNVLRLTLLKSPTYPWPEADQGEHRFRYAVFLHDGDRQAVHEAAEAFNLPLRLVPGGTGAIDRPVSLLEITSGGATVESIKRAEAGSGVIVRLWETEGR